MTTFWAESRRSLLERMNFPVVRFDQEMRGRLPVNDLNQCGCEVRHIALRQLRYAGETDDELELADRVTQIKTKFWLSKEEQDDLFRAAKLLMKLLDDQHLLSEQSFDIPCTKEPTSKSAA